MKRLALVVTAALAAIAGLAAVGGSSGAQPPAPPTGTLELLSLDRETRFKFVDTPPRRRQNAGDTILISGRLRDNSNTPSGQFYASFATTPSRGLVSQGSGTFRLRNGQIVAAGTIDDAGRTDTLAIVGGTGAFTGARGTLVITETRRMTQFAFTFAG
jgi:hypothetical protein